MSLQENIKGLKVSYRGRESGRAAAVAAVAKGIKSQEAGRVETMKTNGLETCRQVMESALLRRSNNYPTSQ